jgi:LPS export ABC transporter protein LptC
MRQTLENSHFEIPNLKIAVALWATAVFVLFPACSGQKKPTADAVSNRDSMPGMRTLGVTTLISDSGYIRYKMVAEEWDIYDKLDPSYWAFEKGIYLEKFDTLLHKDATIKADTAYYYDQKKLWELRGKVHIQNQKGDKFDTELLYWDEKREKVYSDKFIRIEQEDKMLTGYGFESNQQLTDYTIYNNTGIFTVEERPDTTAAAKDSTALAPADSIQLTNPQTAPTTAPTQDPAQKKSKKDKPKHDVVYVNNPTDKTTPQKKSPQ